MSGVLSKDGLLKLRIRSSIEQVLQSIQQAASKVSTSHACSRRGRGSAVASCQQALT